jgi:hypothetical protein
MLAPVLATGHGSTLVQLLRYVPLAGRRMPFGVMVALAQVPLWRSVLAVLQTMPPETGGDGMEGMRNDIMTINEISRTVFVTGMGDGIT